LNQNLTPTGKEMIDRTRRVYDMVEAVLRNVPQTRGDHMLLYVNVLRRYYWKLVKVTTRPTLILEYASYDAFFLCPAAETCRRRSQEIQHDERERVWKMVAENYPSLANQADFRDNEMCLKEFMKLAKTSELLPTERVIRKRRRNQEVHAHEFSTGQMSLDDCWKRN
jgi:hypothetical protein